MVTSYGGRERLGVSSQAYPSRWFFSSLTWVINQHSWAWIRPKISLELASKDRVSPSEPLEYSWRLCQKVLPRFRNCLPVFPRVTIPIPIPFLSMWPFDLSIVPVLNAGTELRWLTTSSLRKWTSVSVHFVLHKLPISLFHDLDDNEKRFQKI